MANQGTKAKKKAVLRRRKPVVRKMRLAMMSKKMARNMAVVKEK